MHLIGADSPSVHNLILMVKLDFVLASAFILSGNIIILSDVISLCRATQHSVGHVLQHVGCSRPIQSQLTSAWSKKISPPLRRHALD